MKKIIFVLSIIALILVAMMLVQAAWAEAPEYGTCQVFSWQPDRVWFSWLNAKNGAIGGGG